MLQSDVLNEFNDLKFMTQLYTIPLFVLLFSATFLMYFLHGDQNMFLKYVENIILTPIYFTPIYFGILSLGFIIILSYHCFRNGIINSWRKFSNINGYNLYVVSMITVSISLISILSRSLSVIVGTDAFKNLDDNTIYVYLFWELVSQTLLLVIASFPVQIEIDHSKPYNSTCYSKTSVIINFIATLIYVIATIFTIVQVEASLHTSYMTTPNLNILMTCLVSILFANGIFCLIFHVINFLSKFGYGCNRKVHTNLCVVSVILDLIFFVLTISTISLQCLRINESIITK
jgi:hypothetical protein